jgi:transposase-like protein
MEEKNKQQRIFAVQRFKGGESPESICTSLGKSRSWLYKWIGRHRENDDSWSASRSRRPISVSTYSKLSGKTPLKALAASNTKLRFPKAVEQGTG